MSLYTNIQQKEKNARRFLCQARMAFPGTNRIFIRLNETWLKAFRIDILSII